MNASLRCGKVPGLKKSSLKTNDFISFCPISYLKFAAKAIEKVVAFQTCQYISDNEFFDLKELYQSAYKPYHSAKFVLVKVHDDILRPLDN